MHRDLLLLGICIIAVLGGIASDALASSNLSLFELGAIFFLLAESVSTTTCRWLRARWERWRMTWRQVIWKALKESLGRGTPPTPVVSRRIVDFTRSTKDHWIKFEGGDNYNAMFNIRGACKMGDDILVCMSSGRIGRYRIFSLLPDFTGVGDYRARAVGVCYWPKASVDPRPSATPVVKIKGLLGDGTRWVRSDKGELAHLPSGFTKPASEFWKVFHGGTPGSRSTNPDGTTGNPSLG